MTAINHTVSGESGKSSASTSFIDSENTIRSNAQVRMLTVISAGPIEGLANGQSSLIIDGVPVVSSSDNSQNIAGIDWKITTGDGDDTAQRDGFNAIETTDIIGHALSHNSPYTQIGSGDAARLTFSFPQGLARQTEVGIFGSTVEFNVEVRLADGTWSDVAARRVAEKQTRFFEVQLLVELEDDYTDSNPPAIRITRKTPDSEDDTVSDAITWSSVTWIKRDRLSYAGVATLSLTVDAEAFSGRLPSVELDIKGRHVRVPLNYDPETRDYDGIWSGDFKLAYANNPAWVIFDLLTDSHWGLGLNDGVIETYDLYDIARYADEDVDDGAGGSEPRFTFDAIFSRRQSAHDLVQQICGSMRVMMFWSGGRLRFIQDKPGEAVLWLTNNHVEDGAFIYTGASGRNQISHALVSYIDPDKPNEITVEAETNPKTLAQYGYAAQEVALLGCRRRSQARRHARWLLDKADAVLHGISWRAGLDHFAANPIRPGDIVRVFDQKRLASGHYAGRLMAADSVITFDQALTEGATYYLDYEAEDGWQSDLAITTANDADNLPVLTPVDGVWPSLPLNQGAAVIKPSTIDYTGQDYRVVAVRELDRHRVEVDAVRHDNDRFDAIEQNLTIADKAVTDTPDFSTPIAAASGISYQQPLGIAGNSSLRHLLVAWTNVADKRIAFWRLEGLGPDGETASVEVGKSPAILPDLAVGNWALTLKAIDWVGGEGLPATEAVEVVADPIEALPPVNIVLSSGYNQLILAWDSASVPQGAMVEVLEYASSDAAEVLESYSASGSSVILAARTAGVVAYFELRTKLEGGSLSAHSVRLSGAALSPAQNGQDGTVLASATITASTWSDSAASSAITALRSSGAIAGDLVTLSRTSGTPWAETRRYDGANWVSVEAVLSGQALAASTVSASKLQLDSATLGAAAANDDSLTITAVSADLITSGVLRSNDYVAGQTGFKIDTSGSAEFNNAYIRGVLEGSRIEGSILISPVSIIPTQNHESFYTLDEERPIAISASFINGNTITLGPLVIASDRRSRRYNDAQNIVIAANDPYGAPDGEADGRNIYYSRFWADAPIMLVDFEYFANGTPWGEVATTGRVSFKLRTASGRVIATSPILDLSNDSLWAAGTGDRTVVDLLLPSDGYNAGSAISVTRETITNPSNPSLYYTSRLLIRGTLTFDFIHPNSGVEKDGLYLECLLDFSGSSLSLPLNQFYASSAISLNTQD